MAYILQTFRTCRNPETGKRDYVLDKRGQRISLGWRVEFLDWRGKRVYLAGGRTRTEAERFAARIEAEHLDIRRGYRPPHTRAMQHGRRDFAEVAAEYLAWGRAQGGRNNRPRDDRHACRRETYLTWWRKQLHLDVLGDLVDSLAAAEKALQGLQAGGRAGKTLNLYREALVSFCNWAAGERRGYLDKNPLAGLRLFDKAPKSIRRLMTLEEIRALLSACPPHRGLLYEVAFASGFRAGELRSLCRENLDVAAGGYHLPAEVDKARKDRFQPLPADLIRRLAAFAESGEPRRLYEAAFRSHRRAVPDDVPAQPLLYVSTHPDRHFADDCAAAGVSKHAFGGKVDFHAARVAYINLVIKAGAKPREAQELARHATQAMAFGVYGRVRDQRRTALAEAVWSMIKPNQNNEPSEPMPPTETATVSLPLAAGAEGINCFVPVEEAPGSATATEQKARVGCRLEDNPPKTKVFAGQGNPVSCPYPETLKMQPTMNSSSYVVEAGGCVPQS